MDRRELIGLLGVAAPVLAGLAPHELQAVTVRAHHGPRERPPTDVFTPAQRAMVDQISELVIPATDTPGARAAGVVGVIEVIVGEYYHDDERAAFLRGLADVDARCQALFQTSFMESVPERQAAILTGMDAEARAMPRGSAPHFWSRIKGLTLYGYYTSEIGQREELLETFMPGRYDGAAPLPRAPAGGR